MYVVKVLVRHPQGKPRMLKHHTTFCVKQPLSNTCDFYVFLNVVV
jgi:hypothetical protein